MEKTHIFTGFLATLLGKLVCCYPWSLQLVYSVSQLSSGLYGPGEGVGVPAEITPHTMSLDILGCSSHVKPFSHQAVWGLLHLRQVGFDSRGGISASCMSGSSGQAVPWLHSPPSTPLVCTLCTGANHHSEPPRRESGGGIARRVEAALRRRRQWEAKRAGGRRGAGARL